MKMLYFFAFIVITALILIVLMENLEHGTAQLNSVVLWPILTAGICLARFLEEPRREPKRI